MKPEQIQAAADELLNIIQTTSQPANEVINKYTRARRYIGSKDRRQLTDLVWQTIRACPTPLWLKDYIGEDELQAMQQEAPIVLRANGNRAQIQKILHEQGIETLLTKLSPLGLILTKRINLHTIPAYQQGLIEVQDEGSQLVALATNIKPNETVLDYCAGAGGKSLCFAQMMHNQGVIIAHDVSKISLQELKKRATRAKINIIRTTLTPTGLFQHVVVDAPCSGSGTWRRAADARLKCTEKILMVLIKKQSQILKEASAFVQIHGYLHYMTCSLIQEENQKQMQFFLKKHPNFKLIHHQQWSPVKTQTDGFFLATFQRVT